MPMLAVIAIVVSIAAVVAIRRGVDVRFALFTAGLILTAVAGAPWLVFDAFQRSVGKGDIIGPICSAMGYAFVLKATDCDRHMVRLLIRPLRTIRWALIPGGCAIGFLTNMAITSQTATAAAVGPILLPLMVAAGYSRLIAGATLIVGCSVGGNLFNPGEPDIVAIHNATQASVGDIIGQAIMPNILSFVMATLVLTAMGLSAKHRTDKAEEVEDDEPINVVKALLPPLPVLILLLMQPGLNLVPPVFAVYPKGLHISMVMVICTALAMLVTRGGINRLTTQFFEGMGYAFAKVISLIIAASCFIAGLEAAGVIASAAGALASNAALAAVLSPVLTWGLAVISGSGTAPSVSFSQAMLPSLATTNVFHAVKLGISGAIGASVGRTMSPVSAILLFTTTLTDTEPSQLVRIVMWPMLAALGITILHGLVF
ncbi:MAG: C4-dicarboxylate transporter DcuC ['Candidatus Kapabacteria' thiocyanatum]|uniref:C4-dicarboxylate ABC transporter n=1 Tax=Candidatus Kapaibacterium thiocyanatum TaxID=1895771 RepID=A0A1M3KVA3_9BACT|nr:C4-dicarboxylate transporter DcuC ['Candidatus Kapabacteria' thiocyanatum]OJX56343.1 MAG: hypothetical protein BGO89_13495 ['Candidatus Kapabacteria' thiocyanatum]